MRPAITWSPRVRPYSLSDQPFSIAILRSAMLCALLPVKYIRAAPNASGGTCRRSTCKPFASRTEDLVSPRPSTSVT